MAVGSDWRDLCLLILGPACFASLDTSLNLGLGSTVTAGNGERAPILGRNSYGHRKKAVFESFVFVVITKR